MGGEEDYSIDIGISAQQGAIFSQKTEDDGDLYLNGKYNEDDEDDIIVVQSIARRKLATENVKSQMSSLWNKTWVYKIPDGEEGMWLKEEERKDPRKKIRAAG